MSIRVLALRLIPLFAISLAVQSPAADLAEHAHWKRLKALVEPRVASNPNDAEAQWLLSRVRLQYRDAVGALPSAEKAVALDGKNAAYRWQLAQVVGEIASSASVFKQMGLAKRFKREAEAVLALNPRHTGALVGLMEYYYRAPGIIGGDKNKATQISDQILAIDAVDGYLAKVRLLSRMEPPAPASQFAAVCASGAGSPVALRTAYQLGEYLRLRHIAALGGRGKGSADGAPN
ncbi:hypothetical protein BH18ACI5_BH18ACI5_05330 [soil metagenome]